MIVRLELQRADKLAKLSEELGNLAKIYVLNNGIVKAIRITLVNRFSKDNRSILIVFTV